MWCAVVNHICMCHICAKGFFFKVLIWIQQLFWNFPKFDLLIRIAICLYLKEKKKERKKERKKKKEKVYFKSQILVHEYWTMLDHFLRSSTVSFWITPAHSKERKYHIFMQYWYTRNVPVFTNTGMFQYLGPEVYFFQKEKEKKRKEK